jgi:predicted solute-binding protein
VVEHAWRLFQESIDFCRSNLDAIAVDAARWERFPADFLQKYFRSLSFDFDKKLRSGLLRFYREAVELEELETVPPLNFFSPAGVGSLSRGPLVP